MGGERGCRRRGDGPGRRRRVGGGEGDGAAPPDAVVKGRGGGRRGIGDEGDWGGRRLGFFLLWVHFLYDADGRDLLGGRSIGQ
jgi:hypothetical protein